MRIRRRPSLLVLAAVLAALVAAGRSPASAESGLRTAAAISWPPSVSVVISEVETGGASASDEFVEIANVGPITVDLSGFELIGVSSSGATVARRTAWTVPTPVESGRHVLVANAAGVWASIADATYATGLAATGGAVALRQVGGSVVDAVGWGDATNAFVEGAPAAAPPAGASIERLPGGDAGNATDTNDNAADWVVRPVPAPQRLADPPVPAPTPSPSSTGTPAPPTPEPSGPLGSPIPTASPTPTATASSSPTPTPSPSPSQSPAATPTPAPTATPTPTPTPTLSPSPTPSPIPTPMPIADARRLADGDSVVVGGVLTTAFGALEGGRTGFVQDTTAGIALYLDVAAAETWPAGSIVRAPGTFDHRYGLAVVRVRLTDLERIGDGTLPDPVATSTGGAGAGLEGSRIAVTGTIVDIAGTLADGLGLDVDDGSGPLRVIVDPAVLGAYVPAKGDAVSASGPLGRRDGSTGTGFRLHATLAGSLVHVAPPPTPAPSATPSPAPTAAPSPTAAPTPSPTSTPAPTSSATPAPSPTPTASPTGGLISSIATALAAPVGSRVRIRAIVTAPPGRLWTARVGAVQDASGGLFVRFRTDDAAPVLGARLDLAGTMIRSGSRVVLRADERWVASPLDADPVPTPAPIDLAGPIDRAGEGRLVTVVGTVARGGTARPDGHVVLAVVTADGTRYGVTGGPGTGVDPGLVAAGTAVRVTGVGVAGGAPPAGRIWLRAPGDLVRSSGPAASAAPAVTGDQGDAGRGTVAIATLVEGETASVVGVVTVGPGLLTPRGRAIRIEDASGAVDVLMPAGRTGSGPVAGTRLVVTGRVLHLKAGLRIRATELRVDGSAAVPVRTLAVPPRSADIGRIARVTGVVRTVRRSGAAWSAEVGVGSGMVVIAASAATAIPSTGLVAGARVRATGLVTEAPSTSADRTPRIVPRGPADVSLAGAGLGPAAAPAAVADSAGSSGAATGGAVAPGAAAGAARGGSSAPQPSGATAAPLRSAAQLVAAAAGESVLVSGVLRGVAGGMLLLDDGSGLVRVALRGPAAPLADVVSAGDAIRAAGTTERDGAGVVAVVVDDPSAIVRAGSPSGASGSTPAAGASPAAGSLGTLVADGIAAGVDQALDTAAVASGAAAESAPQEHPADTGGSPSPLDPLTVLLAVLGAAGGIAATVAVRRRRSGPLDPAVARRLAELGADAWAPRGDGARPDLDAALVASLSSRPTSAGKAPAV